ncbi:hypothetical protein A2U01_0030793 [Trifolium medium]|uniref:Uncharacterized protein n=1 Tax=Trifolium medium TaxID=97028 RepID=A0A392PD52_9FABA|nr:hypothetical protein [Trifolium medium]
MLLWLHQALTCLEIESTLCQQFNELARPNVIDGFLASPTNRVLLMANSALQYEIILPPHSHLIVPEAMVFDVKCYVFENLKTRGFDTLDKTILIIEGTIEELIATEPYLAHQYHNFDENGRLVGPLFRDIKSGFSCSEFTGFCRWSGRAWLDGMVEQIFV